MHENVIHNREDELSELLENFPDDLTADEVRRRYSDRINRDLARFDQSWAAVKGQTAPSKQYDATISLVAKECFVRLREGLEALVDQVLPSPQPVLAWRGVDSPKDRDAQVVRKAAFEKFGENCVLKVVLEGRSTSVDMVFRLMSILGEPIRPFALTVVDLDNGAILLKDKQFSVGEAVLRGVKKGSYRVEARGGDKARGDFEFKIY